MFSEHFHLYYKQSKFKLKLNCIKSTTDSKTVAISSRSLFLFQIGHLKVEKKPCHKTPV